MKKVIGGLVIAGCLLGAAVGVHAYRIGEMRAPIVKMLSDPASAQFQSEKHQGNWLWPKGALCGEVNSKNQMGGYVGFKKFVTYRGTATIEGDAADNEFIEGYCK